VAGIGWRRGWREGEVRHLGIALAVGGYAAKPAMTKADSMAWRNAAVKWRNVFPAAASAIYRKLAAKQCEMTVINAASSRQLIVWLGSL